MTRRNANAAVERRAYTVDEFCEAYRLTPRSVYRLWADGKGPRKTKVGHRTIITVEDAEAWEHSASNPVT